MEQTRSEGDGVAWRYRHTKVGGMGGRAGSGLLGGSGGALLGRHFNSVLDDAESAKLKSAAKVEASESIVASLR
jgi:hypothetical protein